MRHARLLSCAVIALAICLPDSGYAMTTRVLDFARGQINADWAGQGDISMEQATSGVLLRSGNGTGMLTTTLDEVFQPQSGVIRVASETPQSFSFIWTMMSDASRTTFTVPFDVITGGEKVFSLHGKPEWRVGKKKIGILLPPQTTLMLKNIELRQNNRIEQLLHAVASFWVFDELRPYSINFVWGPQIGWNAIERQQLYDVQPPISLSGTLAAYGIILMIIIGILGSGLYRKTSKTTIVRRIGILLIGAWILFDVRMGSEFLSWVWHDHTTYIAAEAGEREFRDRNAFYDFAAFAAPFVADRESYVFFAEYPWPYLGNMRYLTYPSIPGIDYMNDDTWVIYRRPDMAVSAAGQMTVDGEPVSPQGTVLGRFDDHSFIFRITK